MQKKTTSKRQTLEIKALGEFALPKKSKRGSIGYDLTVPEDIVIPAHSRKIVPMNFAINLPPYHEAKIESRSGFSAKGMEGWGERTEKSKIFGIIPVKKKIYGRHRYDADVLSGKIDPLYHDSIGVIIRNNDEEFVLRKGTRIAQMTIYRTIPVWFDHVEELSGESRGGGFGSSGSGNESTSASGVRKLIFEEVGTSTETK